MLLVYFYFLLIHAVKLKENQSFSQAWRTIIKSFSLWFQSVFKLNDIKSDCLENPFA